MEFIYLVCCWQQSFHSPWKVSSQDVPTLCYKWCDDVQCKVKQALQDCPEPRMQWGHQKRKQSLARIRQHIAPWWDASTWQDRNQGVFIVFEVLSYQFALAQAHSRSLGGKQQVWTEIGSDWPTSTVWAGHRTVNGGLVFSEQRRQHQAASGRQHLAAHLACHFMDAFNVPVL